MVMVFCMHVCSVPGGPETGVTDSCELPCWCWVFFYGSSERIANALSYWTVSPALQSSFFISVLILPLLLWGNSLRKCHHGHTQKCALLVTYTPLRLNKLTNKNLSKGTHLYQPDGSGEDACHQGWQAEFSPRDPHHRRREPAPVDCLLTSTCGSHGMHTLLVH